MNTARKIIGRSPMLLLIEEERRAERWAKIDRVADGIAWIAFALAIVYFGQGIAEFFGYFRLRY